jgi:uncharacterized lipoprotein YmbA
MKTLIEMTPPAKAARAAAIALLAAAGLIAGCRLLPIQPPKTDAIRYYTLSAPAAGSALPAAPGLRLWIRRVDLPAYLEYKPFVMRLGPNEVKVVDDVRWAEPLDQGVAAVLRRRLEALTGAYGLESREAVRDYEVVVQVLNCEGEINEDKGSVRFAAEIDLFRPGASSAVVAHRSFTAEPAAWDGKDYAALAQLLSHAVADLGDAIVATVPK